MADDNADKCMKSTYNQRQVNWKLLIKVLSKKIINKKNLRKTVKIVDDGSCFLKIQ